MSDGVTILEQLSVAICLKARPRVLGTLYSLFMHWGITYFESAPKTSFPIITFCCQQLSALLSEHCLLTCHEMSPSLPLESPFHAESEPFQRPSEEISVACQPDSGIQMTFLA